LKVWGSVKACEMIRPSLSTARLMRIEDRTQASEGQLYLEDQACIRGKWLEPVKRHLSSTMKWACREEMTRLFEPQPHIVNTQH
jgi:hypothetical protein